MSAKAWAAKYAKRLRSADLIMLNAPKRVREDKGNLLVIEGPFDEYHRNAGDTCDPGCHVRDADGWLDESCLMSGHYLEPLSDEELAEEEAAKAKVKRRKANLSTCRAI